MIQVKMRKISRGCAICAKRKLYHPSACCCIRTKLAQYYTCSYNVMHCIPSFKTTCQIADVVCANSKTSSIIIYVMYIM